MFDLYKISKSKFNVLKIISYILYFCLITVGPCIVVAIKYQLFNLQVSKKVMISGFAIIFLIIIATISFTKIKEWISKISDNTIGNSRFKSCLMLVLNILKPVIAIVILYAFKKNSQLAIETAYWIVGFYLVAAVYSSIWMTSIDREIRLRELNNIDKEKDKRK